MSDEKHVPKLLYICVPTSLLKRKDMCPTKAMLLCLLSYYHCDEVGGCYASNEYLAERLNILPNSVAKHLVSLRKLKLIEDVSFNGRRRVVRGLIQVSIGFKSNPALDLNPSDYKGNSNPTDKKDIKEESKESENAYRLSLLLFEKILVADPKKKKPNMDMWAKEMDKINRLDNRDWPEIESAIETAHSIDFWKGVVLSPQKVRKHFTTLIVEKAKEKNSKPQAKSENFYKNLKMAKRGLKKYSENVAVFDDHVKIYVQDHWEKVSYDELGFQEQVNNCLVKGGHK